MPQITNEVNVRMNLVGHEGFRKAVTDLRKDTKLLEQELKSVDAAYRGNAKNSEYLETRANLLSRIVQKQYKEYDQLTVAIEEAKIRQTDYAKKVEETTIRYQAAEKALNDFKNSGVFDPGKENELSRAVAEVKVELNDYIKSYNKATQDIIDFTAAQGRLRTEIINTKSEYIDTSSNLDKISKGYGNIDNSASSLASTEAKLKNELKGVEGAFTGNKKSIEYLSAKEEVLVRLLDVHKQRQEALRSTYNNSSAKLREYERQIDSVEEEISELNVQIESWSKGEKNTTEEMENSLLVRSKLEIELDVLNNKYKEERENLDSIGMELSELDAEHKNLEGNLFDVRRRTDELNESLKQSQKPVEEVTKSVDELAEILALEGVAGKISEIKDALLDCSNAATDFESSFTDVKKVIDGSEEQLENLKEQIIVMSSELPYSASAISEIAAIGGQLGVTVDNLGEFTEIMLGLGSATSLTAEDASTMIAQFQNITGLQTDNLSNFASALVELGNSSATTETKIMAMAQRMASPATMAGMSETQILGLATALSSVGIEAEMGGTAVQKMIDKLQGAARSKDASKWAKVMGLSVKDFKKIVETDMSGAINLLINGISQSDDAYATFADDLGINEVRLKQALMALASSQKNATYYTEMANAAWEENIALQEEVGRKLNTSETKNKLLENSFQNLKIAIGEELNPVLDKMKTDLTGTISDVTKWVRENPKTVKAISTIVLSLAGVTSGLLGVAGTIKLVTSAVKVLSTTTGSVFGIITLLASAAIAVATYGESLYDSSKKYRGSVEDYNEAFSSASESIKIYGEELETTVEKAELVEKDTKPIIDRLRELESQGNLTNSEQAEYNRLLDELKRICPELNLELDEETGLLKDGADALERQVKSWREKIELEARERYIANLYDQKYANQGEINKNEKRAGEIRGQLSGAESDVAKAKREFKAKTGFDYDTFVQNGYYNTVQGGIAANTTEYKNVVEAIQNYDSLVNELNDVGLALENNYALEQDINKQIEENTKEYETQKQVINGTVGEGVASVVGETVSKVPKVDEKTIKKIGQVTSSYLLTGMAPEELANTFMSKLQSNLGEGFNNLPSVLKGFIEKVSKNLGITIPVSAYIKDIKMPNGGNVYTTNNNQQVYLYSNTGNEAKIMESLNKVLGNKTK